MKNTKTCSQIAWITLSSQNPKIFIVAKIWIDCHDAKTGFEKLCIITMLSDCVIRSRLETCHGSKIISFPESRFDTFLIRKILIQNCPTRKFLSGFFTGCFYIIDIISRVFMQPIFQYVALYTPSFCMLTLFRHLKFKFWIPWNVKIIVPYVTYDMWHCFISFESYVDTSSALQGESL